jgi:hypothetical protein
MKSQDSHRSIFKNISASKSVIQITEANWRPNVKKKDNEQAIFKRLLYKQYYRTDHCRWVLRDVFQMWAQMTKVLHKLGIWSTQDERLCQNCAKFSFKTKSKLCTWKIQDNINNLKLYVVPIYTI